MGELILGPVIGGLAHDHAHLWGRSDGPGVLHAWLGRQPDLSDAYLSATSLPLAAQDGYAGVAVVKRLQPDTSYYYALTLSDSPPELTWEGYPAFTTSPVPGRRVSFNFAFGSCFRPKDAQGGQIFRTIDELLRGRHAARQEGEIEIKVDEVKPNVPVDDAKFEKPAA